MESKLACVVNQNGFYIDLVRVDYVPKLTTEGGIEYQETPYCYKLREGERLIFTKRPDLPAVTGDGRYVLTNDTQMLKPRWNPDGKTWEETAMPEEIAAAQPEPVKPKPTEIELLAAELSLAIAEMQTQMDMAVAELSIAIAERWEGGEKNV